MTNIKNITVARTGPTQAKTAKTLENAREQRETSNLVCLRGADALCEYNKPLIHTKSPWWQLSAEQVQNIKDEIDFIIDRIEEDRGEKLDDKTISFVVSTMCDLNTKNLGYELRSIGIAFNKFMDFTPEKQEQLLNSDFVRLAANTLTHKSGKFSCFNIPSDKLTELNKFTKDELTAKFLKDYLKTHDKNGFDISIELSQIEEQIAPVVEFTKKEGAKDFYDLLSERSYNDISGISEILSKRIDGLTGPERKELYSVLKILLGAKTPKGNNIFGYSKASDTTEKMLLSGIENILDAKENDPEKFEQLMELLNLTESGAIPPSVLGVLPKKAEINTDFLTLIKQPKDKIIEQDGKIFYKNKNEMTLLKMDRETFEELFPPVQTMALGQGQLGDCYLVSAIFDFMKNPTAKGLIYQMFEQNGDEITVTIPDAKDFPIKFSKKEFLTNKNQQVNASLGIQMLEEAYSKTRSLKYGTTDKITAIEGGTQFGVYDALLGQKVSNGFYLSDDSDRKPPTREEILEDITEIEACIEKLKKEIKDIKYSKDMTLCEQTDYFINEDKKRNLRTLEALERMFFEDMEATLDNIHMVSSGELLETLVKYGNDDNYLIALGTKNGDDLDKDRLICGKHAYSVLGVDEKNKTVKVVNPWNTAQYVTLSFEDFMEYFNAASLVKI